jgi:hypothetical protein
MKVCISYAIAQGPRRALVSEFLTNEISARSIARAILKHEFAEVDAPFGPLEVLTAEQALAKFAITDVTTSILDDGNPADR